MNVSLQPTLLRLHQGEVRRLRGDRCRGIAVLEGEVWLTLDNDRRDFILAAGDSLDVPIDADVVVQAFVPSALLPLVDPRRDGNRSSARERLARRIGAYERARRGDNFAREG